MPNMPEAVHGSQGARALKSRVGCPAFGLVIADCHALRNDFVPGEVVRDDRDHAGWFPIRCRADG